MKLQFLKETLRSFIEDKNPRYVGICIKKHLNRINEDCLYLITLPTLGSIEDNIEMLEEFVEDLDIDNIYRVIYGNTLDSISCQYLSKYISVFKEC